jgi:hypothetical protein
MLSLDLALAQYGPESLSARYLEKDTYLRPHTRT